MLPVYTRLAGSARAGQFPDKRHIAIQKIVGGQSFEPFPQDLLKNTVQRLAFELGDAEEDQLDRRPARIRIFITRDLRSDRRPNIQLLFQFACKRPARLLSRLDFPARELPLAGVVASGFALSDQNQAVFLNDGGDNDGHCS